jgi:hypothetical protein
MFAGPDGIMGGFAAYDPLTNKAAWYNKEKFSAWGGALATAPTWCSTALWTVGSRLLTLSGKELWKFPSWFRRDW